MNKFRVTETSPQLGGGLKILHAFTFKTTGSGVALRPLATAVRFIVCKYRNGLFSACVKTRPLANFLRYFFLSPLAGVGRTSRASVALTSTNYCVFCVF